MSKFAGLELAVDQPSRMVIRHPATKQPLLTPDKQEGWIDLLSDDSQAARDYDDRVADRRVKRGIDGEKMIPAAEVRAEEAGRLAALTAGWRLICLDGTPSELPFSPDNARELYAAPALAWLREQVEKHKADRANFIKPPAGG